jgi:hypothetical protein
MQYLGALITVLLKRHNRIALVTVNIGQRHVFDLPNQQVLERTVPCLSATDAATLVAEYLAEPRSDAARRESAATTRAKDVHTTNGTTRMAVLMRQFRAHAQCYDAFQVALCFCFGLVTVSTVLTCLI